MIEIPSLRPETRYGIPPADQLLFNREYIIGYSYLFRQPRWALQLIDPENQVANVDRLGDRHLTLCHRATNRRQLESSDAEKVLHYTSQLWGFPVKLEVEEEGKIRAAS